MNGRTKRLFVVRDSPIHGKGVFAVRRIPKGMRIVEYTGERIGKRESNRRAANGRDRYIYYMDRFHDIDAVRGGNAAMFVNHSCDNNARVSYCGGRIFYVAVRAIRKGEEIVSDYGMISGKPEKCCCGAATCRGFMNEKAFVRRMQNGKNRAT